MIWLITFWVVAGILFLKWIFKRFFDYDEINLALP